MALFKAVVVVELPAIRRQTAAGGLPAAPGASASAAAAPRFVVILPHGDAAQLPRYVLEFCFPDLDQLVHRPYHYDHSVEEFVFTLTPKDQPAVRQSALTQIFLRARRRGGKRAPLSRPRVPPLLPPVRARARGPHACPPLSTRRCTASAGGTAWARRRWAGGWT